MKDIRCSPEEAAAFLEKDFKRAFRKGYTPKELCALLKKAGIVIPERLVARYQEPLEEPEVNWGDRESEKQGSRDERNSMVPSRKLEEAEAVNASPTPPRADVSLKPKPEPALWDVPDNPGHTHRRAVTEYPHLATRKSQG